MVNFSNKTIKNVLSNYTAHEIITWDDRDPPWVNKTMKRLNQQNNDAYKCYIRNMFETFNFYNHNQIFRLKPLSRDCVKKVQIQVFCWSLFSYIRTEYRKIRTRKYSVFRHFSRGGKYYSRMSKQLTGTFTSPKTCWSVLKPFLNNKKHYVFHQVSMKKDLIG